jgi:hypothetical protein
MSASISAPQNNPFTLLSRSHRPPGLPGTYRDLHFVSATTQEFACMVVTSHCIRVNGSVSSSRIFPFFLHQHLWTRVCLTVARTKGLEDTRPSKSLACEKECATCSLLWAVSIISLPTSGPSFDIGTGASTVTVDRRLNNGILHKVKKYDEAGSWPKNRSVHP